MVKPSTLGFRRNRREEHHKPRGTHAFVGKFVFILLIYLGLRVRGHGAYGRLAANFGVLSEHMPLRCGDSSFSSYFIVRFLGAIPRKVRDEKTGDRIAVGGPHPISSRSGLGHLLGVRGLVR